MTTWKLIPLLPTQEVQTVFRTLDNGLVESCLVTAPEYLKWLAEGNTPLPADEPAA
jgi:hypothetical protein